MKKCQTFLVSSVLPFNILFLLTFRTLIRFVADEIPKLALLYFLQRKCDLTLHMKRLLGRRFTRNIKPYFLWKTNVCCNLD